MSTARLTLFVRRGCHLCDAAEQAVRPVADEQRATLDLADVDDPATDALLRAHYDLAVPVLHLDGVEVARGRIEASAVRGFLALRDTVLVVMAKFPEVGRVKTRLTVGEGAISPELAAQLHEEFLRTELRILARLGAGTLGKTVLCFDPPSAEPHFRKLLQAWNVSDAVVLLPQGPGDLGRRLVDAYDTITDREGTNREGERARVLFFGADTPHLTPDLVLRAVEALAAHPAVVGPSSDGGYWTLGVRGGLPLREILHGVPWSSGRELAKTVERLGHWGYPPCLLDVLDDVDRPADLSGLAKRLAGSGVPEHSDLLKRLGPRLSNIPL